MLIVQRKQKNKYDFKDQASCALMAPCEKDVRGRNLHLSPQLFYLSTYVNM